MHKKFSEIIFKKLLTTNTNLEVDHTGDIGVRGYSFGSGQRGQW